MLFESLDKNEQELATKRSGARAIIAANQKVDKTIRPYLAVALDSPGEYYSRLEYVAGAISDFVRDACAEYDADFETVRKAVLDNLRFACGDCGCDCGSKKCSCEDCSTCGTKEANAGWGEDPYQMGQGAAVPAVEQPSTFQGPACPHCRGQVGPDGACVMCGHNAREGLMGQDMGGLQDRMQPMSNTKWSAPHPDDCGCNFPTCVKKREGADPEPENITSEARTGADVPTGDTYTQERVDLPKAGPSGLSDVGSPKIDKSPVPKDGLKPVDVPSKSFPSEMQDIEQQADLDTQTNQGANGTPDPTRHPRERVDADSPMQPAETRAPRTKTFPNGNQADPVTSKWQVEGGQPEANI